MKAAILLVALSATIFSCTAVKNTNRTKNDKVYARVDERQDELALVFQETTKSKEVGRGLVADYFLGKGISLAKNGVKKLIEADRKRFTAEYNASLSNLYFYSNVSTIGVLDPIGMQFNGFSIFRDVPVSKRSTTMDTALYVAFEVDKSNPLELLNNSLFHLNLKDFRLKYAKAKVPAARWYFPWTLHYRKKKELFLTMEIAFNATWFDDNAALHNNVEIGKFFVGFDHLPLDPKAQANYMRSCIGKHIDGYSMLVPRSAAAAYGKQGFIPAYGQGLYTIIVKIKEAGKEVWVSRILYENSSQVINDLIDIKTK
jgi:hypothetical protein